MAKSYEALIPVAVESGQPPVPAGERVELNEQDAEVFLRRGFVKEPEKKRKQSNSEE